MSEDFQNGFGDFFQSMTATAEFIRFQGSTPSEPSGPRVDHTFMNESGKITFVIASILYSWYTATCLLIFTRKFCVALTSLPLQPNFSSARGQHITLYFLYFRVLYLPGSHQLPEQCCCSTQESGTELHLRVLLELLVPHVWPARRHSQRVSSIER